MDLCILDQEVLDNQNDIEEDNYLKPFLTSVSFGNFRGDCDIKLCPVVSLILPVFDTIIEDAKLI